MLIIKNIKLLLFVLLIFSCIVIYICQYKTYLFSKEVSYEYFDEYELESANENQFDTIYATINNHSIIVKPNNFQCPIPSSGRGLLMDIKDYVHKPNQREVLIVQAEINPDEMFLFNLEKIFSNSRIKFRSELKFYINQTENIPSIVVFESHHDYNNAKRMPMFQSFFVKNRIGIVVFNKYDDNTENNVFDNCQLSDDNFLQELLYITKFNRQKFKVNKTMRYNREFSSLFFNKETSHSILKCENNGKNLEDILFVNKVNEVKHAFVGIESIEEIWLLKSLFIDAIRYLSNGEIDTGLKRYVQIDIDDIFVSKMNPEDVIALLTLQEDLSKKYFTNNEYHIKFVIGYCGSHFQEENPGDQIFIGK